MIEFFRDGSRTVREALNESARTAAQVPESHISLIQELLPKNESGVDYEAIANMMSKVLFGSADGDSTLFDDLVNLIIGGAWTKVNTNPIMQAVIAGALKNQNVSEFISGVGVFDGNRKN